MTPTPPPVAVSIAPVAVTRRNGGEQPAHPAANPKNARGLGSLVRLIALSMVVTLVVLAVTAWRSMFLDAASVKLSSKTGLLSKSAQTYLGAALRRADQAAYSSELADGAGVTQLKHDGHVPLQGGLLVAPRSFVPHDGHYDLIIHFHGDVGVVRESVEVANLNAALAIINLGVVSTTYRSAYNSTNAYDKLLASVQRAVAERGVEKPKLRRIALSAWSAGYGAVDAILRHRRGDDPLDAVLVLDGIHTQRLQRGRAELNPTPLRAAVQAAKLATADKLLFSITYSEIEPGSYVGTAESARYLLKAVGGDLSSDPVLDVPEYVSLKASRYTVAPDREKRLFPISDTRIGQLRVRGFRGNTRMDHAAHLLQMAATTLRDLADRWNTDVR